MKATRLIKWQGTKDELAVEVSVETWSTPEIAYADGYNIPTGKITTGETIKYKAFVAGVEAGTDHTISLGSESQYGKLGYVSRVGQVAFKQDIRDLIDAAIAEMIAETSNEEYKTAKVAEKIEEEKLHAEFEADRIEYKRQIKNGLCPKCGTYCYGDCSAN